MAFGTTTINDFGGAAGDYLQGQATSAADDLKAQGDFAAATNYGLAATLAGQNEEFSVESTQITQAAIQRNFEKTEGKTETDIAGGGFENSGSAQDIMRSNAQQGAIAHQVAGAQGLITEAGYAEQQTAYSNMQATSNAAGQAEEDMGRQAATNGEITGGIKAAAGIASLFLV